jgi:hypothetical protein
VQVEVVYAAAVGSVCFGCLCLDSLCRVDQHTFVNYATMTSNTSSNPSHFLISRNPPSPAHPQLFPTSTPRHSHTSSIPPPAASPGTSIGQARFFPVSNSTSTTEVFYRHVRHRSASALHELSHFREDISEDLNEGSSSQPHRERSRGLVRSRRTGIWDEVQVDRMSSGSISDSLEDEEDGERLEPEQEPIDVHPTFQPDAELKGSVKVLVGKNEFWCHKEILWFASPFFRDMLQGE